MKEDNYLINYYKNNNGIKERMEIKHKLLVKLDILLILAVLFFLMLNFSTVSNFKGEVEVIATIKPFKIVPTKESIFATKVPIIKQAETTFKTIEPIKKLFSPCL